MQILEGQFMVFIVAEIDGCDVCAKMKEEFKDTLYGGYCEWMDRRTKPREFLITLDRRLDEETILIMLAHEMVHVKQYAYKQLKHNVRSLEKVIWKGRYVNEKKVKYERLPWEREAFSMEDGLFIMYVADNDAFEYFFG